MGMIDMMDEDKLLQAARKFDKHALGTIFDLHSGSIYKYALRLCRDPLEADNVVGDVFALLLEQLAEGKGPRTNLKSYLYQITYHVIVDRSRRQRLIAPLEQADEIHVQHTFSVTSQAEDDDIMGAVIEAMFTQLTPDQRDVLILRFVEGFNVHETAEIVGRNVNNVKVIQNRGLAKLRQVLNQKVDS